MQTAKRQYSKPNRILFWSMITLASLCFADGAILAAEDGKSWKDAARQFGSGLCFSTIAAGLRTDLALKSLGGIARSRG